MIMFDINTSVLYSWIMTCLENVLYLFHVAFCWFPPKADICYLFTTILEYLMLPLTIFLSFNSGRARNYREDF